MHTEHKTWLPIITVGLIVGFMLGYVAQHAVPTSSVLAEDQESYFEETLFNSTSYTNDASQILGTYKQNQNANEAYENLIALRVPKEFTKDHLALILALGAVRSNSINATVQLQTLLSTLNWLKM